MGYLAIARKWRPQQFVEVLGQQHITQTLINAIKLDRLGHAYLFTGPRGIGKTTIARILAKSLNCLSSPSPVPQPCDRCDSCREIADGTSLDVLEIDGASNTGVDDVRELRQNVKYAPARGKYKVYIIDEVHMLSTNAFNALLKTLEEPPSHIKFFFATTEPHKIPPTIISRCQRFDLRKIPRALIKERLEKVLEAEKVGFEEGALLTVASCADGSMRDAESILDQLLVYCESEIHLVDVLSLLGLVPADILNRFSQAIAEEDIKGIIGLLEEVFNHGWGIPQFLSALVSHFRDLLLITVSGKQAGFNGLTEEARRETTARAGLFTRPQLVFILDELIKLERNIKYALSERVALEVTLIKLAQSRGRVYLDDLIRRLEALEQETESESASSGSPGVSRSGNETGSVSPNPVLRQVVETWPDFLETLGKNRAILKTYIHEGVPAELADGVLTVLFGEEFDFHRESLESPANMAYLENLLKNKLGFAVKLKFGVGAAKSSSPGHQPVKETSPPGAKRKLIKQSPLIKTAIEMFDGTIVGIKE